MPALAGDAIAPAEDLKRWGVKPGTRVGIYCAPTHIIGWFTILP